jgi:phage shock protein A
MGMFARMSTIVKSKMNRLLDSAEDPRETLDYSYEQQREMLQNVKRGVVEMVSAKRRIQQQATKVQENIVRLDQQARQAIEVGREDLARLALQRKQTALIELQALDEQISGMELEQEKLTLAEQRLQAKVEAFRTKKEIIKAQYTAAQAQVRIGSALSGLSEEMGDISMAIERAENSLVGKTISAGNWTSYPPRKMWMMNWQP